MEGGGREAHPAVGQRGNGAGEPAEPWSPGEGPPLLPRRPLGTGSQLHATRTRDDPVIWRPEEGSLGGRESESGGSGNGTPGSRKTILSSGTPARPTWRRAASAQTAPEPSPRCGVSVVPGARSSVLCDPTRSPGLSTDSPTRAHQATHATGGEARAQGTGLAGQALEGRGRG